MTRNEKERLLREYSAEDINLTAQKNTLFLTSADSRPFSDAGCA